MTSEQGEYKHQQDLLWALKPANTPLPPNCLGGDVLKCTGESTMRLQLEKQLLFLSLLCILSKVREMGHWGSFSHGAPGSGRAGCRGTGCHHELSPAGSQAVPMLGRGVWDAAAGSERSWARGSAVRVPGARRNASNALLARRPCSSPGWLRSVPPSQRAAAGR